MNRTLSSSLFLAIIALMGVGLVQVYSSSFIFAIESYGDGLFFFKRQLIYTLVALIVILVTVRVPFHWIEKWGWWLWIVAGTMVAMVFIPHLGIRVGGALRWLQLPMGVRFEPSELLKISFVLLFSVYINRSDSFLAKVKMHWLVLLLLIPLIFLLKQPDFGSFAIITLVGFSMLFAFGLQWRYILPTLVTILGAFYFLVMSVPYRKARILAFLDPWSDPAQRGFQVIQSMLSFHSGKISGTGLGNGQGKLFFLPEAHTDFTLAVFGEEMGFIGILILFSIYGFLIFRGIQISIQSTSPYKRALALGLIMTFALSVFINSGVVMGMLPTKGLTLPFLSYGGSSLVMYAFLFGIILNIENTLEENKFTKVFKRTKWSADQVK